MQDAETERLAEDASRKKNWKRWGPYLAERQWGTVREDYSAHGDPWGAFPHDHARSRAYRWGEDGLLGLTDRECRLCFAVALWNGKDPILKERLFGLTGPEGNHGEDVKEQYFYLDSTPTHSWLRALYKYPQAEFPYARLVEENARRDRDQPELELAETGIFDDGRYFDVFLEMAKATPDDLLIRITIANRGPDAAHLDVLPTLWFRNTWSWGRTGEGYWPRPRIERLVEGSLLAQHSSLGSFRFETDTGSDGRFPPVLFTENETNRERIFGERNESPWVKDAFHEYLIGGRHDAINPEEHGTKAAALYRLDLPPGGTSTLRLRLHAETSAPRLSFGTGFDEMLEQRRREADEFCAGRIPASATDDERNVIRQAWAGLLWTKQFYHYVVDPWLEGDPIGPRPDPARPRRNEDWSHLYNRDVLSMPDKWEYPWFAAWDLAFHVLPLASIDPTFAKEQLLLLLREWYMHPNGQIPAYEWNFSDVNPPVHAWAAWRIYQRDGKRDVTFLARVFQKCLLNFTWWVNRKDVRGRHVFSGGFLGLDNVGVFDRSRPLPTGGHLEQADGTAWMAFYCGTMLAIALELAFSDSAYEDLASKFFEHFVAIADAMNTLGGTGLWDEEDGFYYDQLHVEGENVPLRIRSVVGLLPLIAVQVLDDERLHQLPGFARRLHWFLENRRDLARRISYMSYRRHETAGGLRLLAIPSQQRLERVLRYLLDEREFLGPYGVRSLSRVYEGAPYVFHAEGRDYRVAYEPGESTIPMFGGNSNWRGPVWFPLNFLFVDALEEYDRFYGEAFRIECPNGSGNVVSLAEAARELRRRLTAIFLRDEKGRRPCHAEDRRFAEDPHWRDLLLFHEYFHGETGKGLGANHQTGWTALVTELLDALHR